MRKSQPSACPQALPRPAASTAQFMLTVLASLWPATCSITVRQWPCRPQALRAELRNATSAPKASCNDVCSKPTARVQAVCFPQAAERLLKINRSSLSPSSQAKDLANCIAACHEDALAMRFVARFCALEVTCISQHGGRKEGWAALSEL